MIQVPATCGSFTECGRNTMGHKGHDVGCGGDGPACDAATCCKAYTDPIASWCGIGKVITPTHDIVSAGLESKARSVDDCKLACDAKKGCSSIVWSPRVAIRIEGMTYFSWCWLSDTCSADDIVAESLFLGLGSYFKAPTCTLPSDTRGYDTTSCDTSAQP